MKPWAVVDAPTHLGLFPSGVEELGAALRRAGLVNALNAVDAATIVPRAYNDTRDPVTHILNGDAIRQYALALADAVGAVIDAGQMPLVLGGDDSVLFGNLLALRRRGRYGLLFLDGHADFYTPESSLTGQASDMDLAIAVGRGPAVLTQIEGDVPLVREADVVAFGIRDADAAAADGSPNIREASQIRVIDLDHIRQIGLEAAIDAALAVVARPDLDGFWLHLDADVLDDAIMPAVDYRVPGGMGADEIARVLARAVATGHVVGMEITIFNPRLDSDGIIAQRLADLVAAGLGAPPVE